MSTETIKALDDLSVVQLKFCRIVELLYTEHISAGVLIALIESVDGEMNFQIVGVQF